MSLLRKKKREKETRVLWRKTLVETPHLSKQTPIRKINGFFRSGTRGHGIQIYSTCCRDSVVAPGKLGSNGSKESTFQSCDFRVWVLIVCGYILYMEF